MSGSRSTKYQPHGRDKLSPQMMQLMYNMWNWGLERKILLSAKHLPGKQDYVADKESRTQGDSSEWKLKPLVFRQLMEQIGPCQVYLFASRLTVQLEIYMSWKPDPGAVATDALSHGIRPRGMPSCLSH